MDESVTPAGEASAGSAGDSRLSARWRRRGGDAYAEFVSHPAAVLLGFLVVMCVALTFADDAFLTRPNLVAVGLAVSVVGIAAAGQTIVIVSGGLDLSTESIIALTSVVVAGQLRDGMPVGVALLAGLGVGAGVGLVNGLVVARLGVNPVITTLGTFTLMRGLARIYAEGRTIRVSDQTMRDIGLSELPGGLPIPVVAMVACFVIGAAVMIWTTFGRNAYLIGDNLEAARLAGIRIPVFQVLVYVVAGSLCRHCRDHLHGHGRRRAFPMGPVARH